MPKGYALCIGLNTVDQSHYQGLSNLNGPMNDARDMSNILKNWLRYAQVDCLVDEEATSNNLENRVLQMVERIEPGDLFVLFYSGHGFRMINQFFTEYDPEFFDQAWCLYDRGFLDDEVRNLLKKFPEGSRVLVISDSCYSGSMIRAEVSAGSDFLSLAAQQEQKIQEAIQKAMEEMGLTNKNVEEEQYRKMMAKNRKFYKLLQNDIHQKRISAPLNATLKLYAAAPDGKVAYDGFPNSRFTAVLKHILSEQLWTKIKRYDGKRFLQDLRAPFSIPVPTYMEDGPKNTTWDERMPLLV